MTIGMAVGEDRVLPHNLDAERSVLGAVLIDNEAYDVAATVVHESMFFRDAHRRIYNAIVSLAEKGDPFDLLILSNELARRGDLDEVGGPAYVSSLVDGVPRATNVQYYAGIVREKAALRELILAANDITASAYEQEDTAARLVEAGTSRLLGCIRSTSGGLVSATDAVGQYGQALDNETLGAPVATGYADLDALMGCMKPGELVVVAARPSVGKTAFALAAADYIAQHSGPAVLFSLEMDQHAIASRLLSLWSHVPAQRIDRKEASDDDWAAIAEAMRMPPSRLWLEFSSRTVTEIGAWCRRAQATHGELRCVFVDYLQLLISSTRSTRDSRQDEVAAISRGLKSLAKELRTVVVALSQLSRTPEARRDKRPQLSDLRESGAIEQDCDLALLLFREEMHKPKPENAGIAEVIVAKNRNRGTGTTRLAFTKELARFANLAHE